jgi:hypothetical protein
VHWTIEARAAAAGVSLSDYVMRDLEDAASRSTLEEIELPLITLDSRLAGSGLRAGIELVG